MLTSLDSRSTSAVDRLLLFWPVAMEGDVRSWDAYVSQPHSSRIPGAKPHDRRVDGGADYTEGLTAPSGNELGWIPEWLLWFEVVL